MIRRWTVLGFVLLLMGSVAGWIFYIPSAERNDLKPLPPYAQVIYRASSPDWTVLENFHFSDIWQHAGPVSRMFEHQPLTVAVASLGGRNRRDTWIAVSAVGPRSVLLRWRLMLFPPENIRPLRSYGAWPVWQFDYPSLPSWARVRFSLTDGLFICSISDDSHDIYYLLDTVDGRRPSRAGRKDHP